MARKQAVAIQESVETNEEYEQYIETYADKLICMEVYSDFCGPCLATSNAIRKGKMEIGEENIAMVKCLADKIDALKRFQNHSEPTFLFIVRKKLIRAVFGPNGIELCRVMEEELHKCALERDGIPVPRKLYEIHEMLPEEAERQKENLKLEEEYRETAERLRVLTLAARKRRVNERLARKVKHLNYIMFWPQCHQAHYDLYEKWDNISVTVAAKETFQMDEEAAHEAFYMSDVDPNKACLHALFDGEALLVLFKINEADTRDFVKLMRYSLYEEIPKPKEDVPPEKQVPPIPAYERYATISKSARKIRRERYNARMQKLQEEKEVAERLAAEQDRLAREAAEQEEKEKAERLAADQQRLAREAAAAPQEPIVEEPELGGEEPSVPPTDASGVTSPEETGEGSPEEVVLEVAEEAEVIEVFDSDVEVEGEDYIPPGGLFVPGLYTPANELSKACGLAYFFPKQVQVFAETIETENLPPHVLLLFPVERRYDVQEVINNYSSEILNIGIFVGDDPYKAEHLAYTIKQYDKIIRPRRFYDRLAVMVSRKRSLPLLQLAGCNPVYISADVNAGERECMAMFPVGYGDDYFEEESVQEEEEVVIEPTSQAADEVAEVVEEKVGEEEEEEDEEGNEA